MHYIEYQNISAILRSDYLVNGNYKLIYRVSHNEVIINDVFDARQNPAKINDEKRLNS